MIQYESAPDLDMQVREIVGKLSLEHIDFSRVFCVRSKGSKSRRILARCHVLPRVMQKALGIRAHYVIEIVTENFEKLSEEERVKTLIHELLHIPKAFGGGFRHHRTHVNRRTVDEMYQAYRGRIKNETL